jgi:hypothetical protein
MGVKEWAEVAMLILMGAGLLGMFVNRFHLRRGLGIRITRKADSQTCRDGSALTSDRR